MGLIIQNIATIAAGLVIAFTAWKLAFITLAVPSLTIAEGYLKKKKRIMKGFSGDAKMYEEASQAANDAVGSIRIVAFY